MTEAEERLKRLKELQAKTTILWREWFNEPRAAEKIVALEKYQSALREEEALRRQAIEDGGY